MKTINKYIVTGIACLLTGFLGACSNQGAEELDTLIDRVEVSRATAVEANIKDLTEGGLDAALEAAVGADNKYKVTNLTLAGKINGADVVTLHKLANLETLDVKGLSWTWAEDGSSQYELDLNVWGGDGNDSHISASLYEGVITSWLFAGFQSLKSIVLPDSGIERIDYMAFGGCMALESIQIPSSVTTLNNESLARIGVKTLTIPSSVTEVDYDFCRYDENLQAVFWESSADVPHCNDMNALLYLSDENTIVIGDWNVIRNGVAESITIKAKDPWNTDNYSFVAPKAFTAKKISYTRYFNNWTPTGGNTASGWETIVLPFVPISITHESKGVIAPFNSGVADAKPFWLRSLTVDGFVDVTAMKANVPYIIAMPNNDAYFDEYRLYGWVTFAGENVEIPEVVSQPAAVQGPNFSLQPTYASVEQSNSIYSLNVRDGQGYNSGSYFMRGGGDVRAFEAYAVVGGRSVQKLIDLDCSSRNTRSADAPNKTGIPQIGDM